MSKLTDCFKEHKCFIPFITAGDPDLDHTVEYVLAMAEAGADIIEIGIPFSDPTAEGPVIQEASLRALEAGFKMENLFDAVRRIREKTDIPLIFMTYINPVFHYGYDAFFQTCKELKVEGFISPDVPFEEKREVAEVARKYGVDVISLISPTSEDRIEQIARDAEGYIYVVSSMGVTGERSSFSSNLKETIETIRKYTDLPCAVGFGISTPQQAKDMSSISDGAIVGSAIVKIVARDGKNAAPALSAYVKEMKQAVLEA
ncbi:MAG: tryptophan synthase subunit alpha [Lachnospiraceae bacterium]|nr:tryptophan synthase subunit alpha [Lachnospiraceae bacterium]